jgi:hypothetical protein
MGREETIWEDVDCIHVAQHRVRWQAVVNVGNFPRNNLLNVVTCYVFYTFRVY